MKLFLVIYAAGHIGGVAGPLPYGMAECEARRDEMRANQAAFLADGINRKTGLPATAAEIDKVRLLRFECEQHDTAPVMGGAG